MKSDNEKGLARLISNRLGDHVTCTVFENELSVVWQRAYKHDSRIKEIEAFAKANGWSVSISDPGIRLTFKRSSKLVKLTTTWRCGSSSKAPC
jgi:hypothetical protein